jgi:phospholipid transport system substrate-binding protein
MHNVYKLGWCSVFPAGKELKVMRNIGGKYKLGVLGLVVLVIPMLVSVSGVYAEEQSPQAIVESVTREVLHTLRTENGDIKKDPARLISLIEQSVVPYFDFTLMAGQVLGRYWRGANADQRKQFTEAFKQLLTNTYAAVFGRYENQTVEVLAAQSTGSADRAVVPTNIKTPGEQDIRVDYRVYRSQGKWLVYDVVVDGISLLINYRSEYARILQQQSLDTLIARLEEKNAAFKQTSN